MKRKVICWMCLAVATGMVGCTTVNDPGAKCLVTEGQSGVETAGLGADEGLSGGGARSTCSLKVEDQVYYFDFDRSDIHPEDRASIDVQGRYLASHPGAHVVLEGNTDPRGSREYNVALGERRAKSIANILRLDGATTDQVTVVSYGAEKLASPGHTEDAYELDRRVNLVYEEK